MSVWFDFDEVDTFTVGTVGRPGERTFFLQARRGATTVTVKCEKQQAVAIAQYLRRVLIDLPEPSDRPIDGAMELRDPIEAAFVLGPVGLGYDRSTDMVLVQLDEVPAIADDDAGDESGTADDDDDDEDDDRSRLRVFLTRSQAVAFCSRADGVAASGRATCRWCQGPIDPDGHACPRMN